MDNIKENAEKRNLIENTASYGAIESQGVGPSENHGKKSIIKRVFPLGFKQDLKDILYITISMTLTQISVFTLGPICLIIAGHIGNRELAAVALAESVLNISGISVMFGLVTVCDTLMSNAFGSVHKKFVGIYLQRALYICPLFCFICWALHINAKPILILLSQDPVVAADVEYFLTIFSPGLLFACLQQVLSRYLINQEIVVPNVIIGLVGNVIHIGLQCLFAFALNWNIAGIAIAQAAAFFIFTVLTLIYILCWKAYVPTWNGWTMLALDDWGLFIKLALAGFVMVAIEWWSFELGIFMNGAIDNISMSATSIVFTVESIFYMLPLSFGVAAAVRVGQFLGNGDDLKAKNAARVTQLTAFIGSIIELIILVSFVTLIPWAFTTDKLVADLVQGLLPLLAVVLVIDSVTTVACGILRATGRQILGAVINFVTFFCIAIPVSYVFLFVLDYPGYGFWWGIIIGSTPAMILYFILQVLINWNKEATKAVDRVEREEDLTTSIRHLEEKSEMSTKVNRKWTLVKRLIFAVLMMSTFIVSLTLRLTLRDDGFTPHNSTTVTNVTTLVLPRDITRQQFTI